MKDYKDLLPYCSTDTQTEAITALIEEPNQKAAAARLGLNERTVRKTLTRVRRHAATRGYSPDHDMTHSSPDSHIVKGVSTLYNEEGGIKQQWVKTDLDKTAQAQLLKDLAEALKEDLPKFEDTPEPDTYFEEEMMAVYPLGDPHVGVLAHAAESGTEWNLKTATHAFCEVFGRLVASAPSCNEAVIVNLGDYFHSDNVAGVTTRSGHHLDTDGHYIDMVSVGVKIMTYMIQAALRHHKTVRVVTAIGNHDDTGAMFLQVALKHMYEDNSRVTIDVSPAPFQYVRFGKCFFGVHHGHTAKADKLPLVMATDRSQEWGETEFRYWYTGHIHHDTKKEYSGCTVETFRTLAAKDAYASWGGYRSGQDSKCIVLHKDFGEVERHTINIAQIKGAEA